MNASNDRNRQPKGRPTGGEFAEEVKAGSGLSLDAPSPDAPGGISDSSRPAYSPRVKVSELNRMLDHDQPLDTRAAAARTPYPGVAERASHDPSALVRSLALEGFDLSASARNRLVGDARVGGLLSAIGHEAPAR